MNKKKTIRIAAIIFTAVIVVYAVWYAVLWSSFTKALDDYGYKDVQTSGFIPYFDGIVVGEITLDQNVSAQKLYIHGYPWQWGSKKPRQYYIEKLVWNASGLAKTPIQWPFKRKDTIHIKDIEIKAPLLDGTIDLAGTIKKPAEAPFLFELTSQSPQFKGDIKGEIHARKKTVHVIDLEFQESQLKDDLIKTKRMSGWFSFSWDKQWNVMGEIESGFANSNGFQTYDNNLKVSGSLDDVDFAFAANVEKTLQPIILDKIDTNVMVRSYEEKSDMPWSGLDAEFIEALKQVLDVQYAQNQETEHVKLALAKAKQRSKRVLLDKPKPVPAAVKVVEQKPVSSANDSLLVIEEKPILPQVSFGQLAQNGLFAGFYYTKKLTVIPHACGKEEEQQCWTARAQGGRLGYGANALNPPYFARIKDVYEARMIRKILKDFDVQVITLKGRGNVLERIDLKGFNADKTPVYIELAIDSLE